MKEMEKKLIDITFNLLYKKGYCATNIRDILEIANITKGSMYYHFKSKHDLVLSAIKYYLEQILQNHWIEPLQNTQNPKKALITQINLYKDMFADKNSFLDLKHGCPLSNFVLDMSDKDELFFNYLKSVYERWEESIISALDKAKELEQTKSNFNTKNQAIFIMASLEGTIATAKAYNDFNVLKRGFKALVEHIENL